MKWNYFQKVSESWAEIKSHLTDCENVFIHKTLDKRLKLKIYKACIKLRNENKNNTSKIERLIDTPRKKIYYDQYTYEKC